MPSIIIAKLAPQRFLARSESFMEAALLVACFAGSAALLMLLVGSLS